MGAKDGESISISLSSSDSYNLYSATGNTFQTTGQTINGTARSTAAEGFDVLSGTVTTGGTVDGSPLADIDAAIKAVDDQRSLLGASQNRFGVHHHQPEQHREQPVGSPQPYSGLRLRDGSVEHVARADPATGWFLGTGTGQPVPQTMLSLLR